MSLFFVNQKKWVGFVFYLECKNPKISNIINSNMAQDKAKVNENNNCTNLCWTLSN